MADATASAADTVMTRTAADDHTDTGNDRRRIHAHRHEKGQDAATTAANMIDTPTDTLTDETDRGATRAAAHLRQIHVQGRGHAMAAMTAIEERTVEKGGHILAHAHRTSVHDHR